MDSSELAMKMLEAEKLNNQLKQLEAEISEAVLELKETQKVGKVKASFTNGRRELDWLLPAQVAPKDVFEKYTTKTESVDYKKACEIACVDPDIIEECTQYLQQTDYAGICKELKLDPVVLKEGIPSVKITYS